VPRDHWLLTQEKQAILDFHDQYPLEGYRRLTFMMLDRDIVACSPASVWRVLQRAGRLQRHAPAPSRKGTGFVQPLAPHQHWHVDVSHLNICGTFYYLCSILDGASRFIVHWEIREKMQEQDVLTILQRAKEKFPDARPRIISDNGPQFIAKEFKEFIRISGMTHVRTAPYYPQSNGKIERWHRSLKEDAIRPHTPLSPNDARRIVANFVAHYNTVRLHGALGYVTPEDKLLGREQAIFDDRDRKLHQARQRRQAQRQQRDTPPPHASTSSAIDFAALRAQVSMAEVLDLLGFVPTSSKGPQQRGPCPVHGGAPRSRTFSVDRAGNRCHCFKCHAGGNALDLWAAATRQGLHAAARDLCHRLSRPIPMLSLAIPSTRGTEKRNP
jgi:putative transposase